MQLNQRNSLKKNHCFACVLLVYLALFNLSLRATNIPDDIISGVCVDRGHEDKFETVIKRYQSDRKQLNTQLVKVLNDSKSSNLDQCCASYTLGEMHMQEAVGSLAAKITLKLDYSQILISHLPMLGNTVAMDALVKIGSFSCPPLIRNLAVSDDIEVRTLSLKALYQIDSDKDIVQLRLQKALQAESNPTKQARLQSALKALGDASFETEVKTAQP